MVFDGHLRVWGEDVAEAGGNGPVLPVLEEGDPVSALAVRVERHVTQPPPRFTEAGLVRRLDALGIGRPSTWVAIVAVLQERGYAVLHDRRFVPTERGRVATAFLEAFFGGWVETGFTAAMEEDLDRIAGGALACEGVRGRRASGVDVDRDGDFLVGRRVEDVHGPVRPVARAGLQRHVCEGGAVGVEARHGGASVTGYARRPSG